jgi:hypothetical protein
VQFVIAAKNTAIAGKQYVLETEVKYRDSLDALMLSDAINLGVDIQPYSGVSAVTGSPVVLVIFGGILLVLVYTVWKLRHKQT